MSMSLENLMRDNLPNEVDAPQDLEFLSRVLTMVGAAIAFVLVMGMLMIALFSWAVFGEVALPRLPVIIAIVTLAAGVNLAALRFWLARRNSAAQTGLSRSNR